MPFVREKISPADREKYGIDALEHGQGRTYFPSWMADRERDAFFLRTGLGPEAQTTFYLFWKGKLSRANGRKELIPETNNNNYIVGNLVIPQELRLDLNAIRELMEQGAQAIRDMGAGPNIKAGREYVVFTETALKSAERNNHAVR